MASPAAPGPFGPLVVRAARVALEGGVRGRSIRELEGTPAPYPPELRAPRGVFVTLKAYPSDRLRGCIGYPLPVLPLHRALVRAAYGAALEDPRFPPLRPVDLDHVVVEVSVLTVPEPLPGPPEGRASGVRVGRDGLLVERDGESGLLLPQVAPEQGWDAEAFLDGTCEKAGLAPGAWRSARTAVLRFHAEVYRERTPSGEVTGDPPN